MLTLDGDISEKLKSVLADPDAMAKITAIASSLGMTQATSDQAAQTPLGKADPSASGEVGNALSALSLPSPQVADPRLALLASLKPLLREDRRERIDALTQALTIASVMKNFRK